MLIELRIRDYAVIDDLSLELTSGLNALSGETGAGKSIIVGALSLLVGERASSQAVRKGAERAVVEAVFEVSGVGGMAEKLEELGLGAEDGVLILRREVASQGRNRAWVNGSPATASTVGTLGGLLVDIHGQHEHQGLLKPADQRDMLDRFAGAEELAREVETLHQRLKELDHRLAEKKARIRELEARGDFLRFQLGEIRDAAPEADEEETLEEEAARLEHAEELARGAGTLHAGLYGAEDSVADRLAALQDLLGRLSRLDPSLEKWVESLDGAYHLLADVGQGLAGYAEGIEHDPARLEAIRVRQDLLFRLKRKYGPELDDVFQTRARLEEELKELDGAAFDVREVEEAVAEARRAFLERVRELTKSRESAVERLQSQVMAVFPDLGLDRGVFRAELTPLQDPGAGGGERVEFLTSLNPGFEPGPLARIASGGELSRVMLALKAILAEADRVPTLVFDEIDAGIGGEVALKVAEKLRDVAGSHQVFVITHLPQLASRAHHQLYVEKDEVEGLAATRVRELAGEERVRELARMLGGDPDSPMSRDHARELLEAV